MGNRDTYSFRRVGGLDTRAFKEKPYRAQRLALALAKGGHQLLQLGRSLDLEKDFVVIVRDLNVEMLGVGWRLGGATCWASVLVLGRHLVLLHRRDSGKRGKLSGLIQREIVSSSG